MRCELIRPKKQFDKGGMKVPQPDRKLFFYCDFNNYLLPVSDHEIHQNCLNDTFLASHENLQSSWTLFNTVFPLNRLFMTLVVSFVYLYTC